MTDKKELPEHIRQAVDLIAAVLRRIKKKSLDKSPDTCLCTAQTEGVATCLV